MIPRFPEFKVVGVGDREAVESYTHRYPPYSDFNFTSLWAWDTSNERMISELNGNLVVRFTDYSTNEPFLSFLGPNETADTAQALIEYCKKEGLSETLRLMPEDSVGGLAAAGFTVEEDRDNFDYLFAVSELSALAGTKFKERRHLVTKFLRLYTEARAEVGDLNDAEIQKDIVAMLHSWEEKKKSENKEYELEHEREAISRLSQTATTHQLVVTSVFLRDIMIGFSIDEILPNQYAISHFIKADTSYAGVYDFLNETVAQHLEKHEIALWNWEQDLGVESLQRSKMSYRPVGFIKKYKVSLI